MLTEITSTRALVLKSVNYRDSDKIISFFTREYGKVSAAARSARASKRRFSGSLEPLCVVEVTLRKTGDHRFAIQNSHVVQSWPSLLSSLPLMESALAMLKWLDRLLPEASPEKDIFDQLVQCWQALALSDADADGMVLGFQLQTLSRLGWHPRFDRCGSCGKKPNITQSAEFNPSLGALRCQACGGGSVRLTPDLRQTLLHIMQHDACDVSHWHFNEKDVVRRLIDALLTTKLDIHAIAHSA